MSQMYMMKIKINSLKEKLNLIKEEKINEIIKDYWENNKRQLEHALKLV